MTSQQKEIVRQAQVTLIVSNATKEQKAWAHGVLQALGLEPKR